MLLSRQNIEAEHAKKLKELEQQEAIMAKLPHSDILVPDFIHQFSSGVNVAYNRLEKEPDSMEMAVDMVDLFGELHPIEYRRRPMFSCLGPVGKYSDKDGRVVYEVENGIILTQTAGDGYGYSRQELSFYPVALDCEITIRFNLPHELQTRIVCDRAQNGQVIRSSRRMVFHRLAMHNMNYSGWEEGNMRYVSVFEGREEMRRNLLLEY